MKPEAPVTEILTRSPQRQCHEVFSRVAVQQHATQLLELHRAAPEAVRRGSAGVSVATARLPNRAARHKDPRRVARRSEQPVLGEAGFLQDGLERLPVEEMEVARRFERKPVLAKAPVQIAAGVRRRKSETAARTQYAVCLGQPGDGVVDMLDV